MRTDSNYVQNIVRNNFTNEFLTGYATINGMFIPDVYSKIARAIENMPVFDDDVWVVSFPKSGESVNYLSPCTYLFYVLVFRIYNWEWSMRIWNSLY